MSRRIGEALIERGLITPAQLDEALRAQLIFGGHLGTCLLELGMIEEEPLGRALSEVLGVPYATADMLASIPDGVIRMLTRELAEEYQAVPLRVEGRSLHLAMIDPSNMYDVDELAFATGRRIIRLVAPELRMLRALEKYYGVRRTARHARTVVLGGVHFTGEDVREAPLPDSVPKPTDPVFQLAFDPDMQEREPTAPLGETLTGPVGSAPRAGAGEGAGAAAAEEPRAVEWREAADRLLAPEPAAPAASAPYVAPVVRSLIRSSTIDELAEQFGGAKDGHDLAAATLGYVSNTVTRTMLLGVQADGLCGWASWGFPPVAAAKLAAGAPVPAKWLLDVVLDDPAYRGKFPATPRALEFFDWLRAAPPAEMIAVPVHLDERLMAVFYADWLSRSGCGADTAEYVRVLRMLRHAMNRVMISRKLRALARAGQTSTSR